jgi:hypothetical protein
MRTSNVLRIHDGALANASGEKHISLALPSLALRRFSPRGAFNPIISAIGVVMGMIVLFVTWSFFFATPGVVHWSLSTDPIAWNLTGEFIFKDIVLFCVCAVLLLASLPRSAIRQRSR